MEQEGGCRRTGLTTIPRPPCLLRPSPTPKRMRTRIQNPKPTATATATASSTVDHECRRRPYRLYYYAPTTSRLVSQHQCLLQNLSPLLIHLHLCYNDDKLYTSSFCRSTQYSQARESEISHSIENEYDTI